MSPRDAFLAHHGRSVSTAPKVLSYAQKVAAHQAAAPCVIPTRKGDECQARKVDGEQFCGPHKERVGKAVVALLGSIL